MDLEKLKRSIDLYMESDDFKEEQKLIALQEIILHKRYKKFEKYLEANLLEANIHKLQNKPNIIIFIFDYLFDNYDQICTPEWLQSDNAVYLFKSMFFETCAFGVYRVYNRNKELLCKI